jgi:hypothetical protein
VIASGYHLKQQTRRMRPRALLGTLLTTTTMTIIVTE